MSLNNQIAILGCGWLGLPLGATLAKNGYEVKGSTTSEQKSEILRGNSITPFIIQLKEKSIEGNITDFLRGVRVLVIAIPPKLRKNPNSNFVAKIKHLIDEIHQSKVDHVIFISSTSVYGNQEGKVTEATTPLPETESGKQLLECEKLFQQFDSFKTTILRFAGLIGNNRQPANFLAGKKGVKYPNAYVNLVHLTDCIGIIKKIIEYGPKTSIYNVAYPYHPSKKEYYTREAIKKGLQPPQFEDSEFKGKWIASDRLMEDVGYVFTKEINL